MSTVNRKQASSGAHDSSSNKRRACDKCYSVKQVCSGGTPCDRCNRCGIVCSSNRPIKRMGRPRLQSKNNKPASNFIINVLNRDANELKKEPAMQPISNMRTGVMPIVNNEYTKQNESMSLNSMLSNTTFESDGGVLSPDLKFWGIASVTQEQLGPTKEIGIQTIHNNTLNIADPQDFNIFIEQIEQSQYIPKREKFYLKHFVNEVAPVIFSIEDSNTFLNFVMPIALTSKLIRYPLVGIAATHISGDHDPLICDDSTRMSPGSTSVYRDFCVYRAKAKTVLYATNIEQSYFKDEVLASFILNAIMEILIGTSLEWTGLLNEANKAIQARGGIAKTLMKKDTKSFETILVQLFCYLDLVSSLSSCSPPFLEKTEGMEQHSPFSDSDISIHNSIFKNDELLDNNDMNLENLILTGYISPELFEQNDTFDLFNIDFGFRFGVAGEIFKILGSISTLSSLRVHRHKSAKYELIFDKIADIIEMKLQNWSVPENVNFEDVTDIQKTQFALAVQWAAFLRLHQIKYGYNRDDDRPKICLQTILEAIETIPDGSNLESALMFPLVLAGSVSTSSKDRNLIIRKVRNIKETLKFPYIGEFERLLLNIWNRDDNEGNLVNWAAVRYNNYPGLVMF